MPKSEPLEITVHIDAIGEEAPGARWAEVTDYRIEGDRVTDGAIDLSGLRCAADLKFTVLNHVEKIPLEFPDKDHDCIWLKKGTQCPDRPGNAHRQLKISARDKGERLVLRVRDLNTVAGQFKYMLRFKRAEGSQTRYVVLDPPIVNSGQGGGGGGIEPPQPGGLVSPIVIGTITVGVVAGAGALLARKAKILPRRRRP